MAPLALVLSNHATRTSKGTLIYSRAIFALAANARSIPGVGGPMSLSDVTATRSGVGGVSAQRSSTSGVSGG